ncbi:hypothetical protein JXB41_05865 [Candidatus Woesearchaeota archaeon]|nr:hypothetical protein [Candidatus Woesearchaeota archaeon]
MIELGGNITLVGFKEIEPSKMIVLKKIIGNYTRKFTEQCKKFESITITLKSVHEIEKSEKYEIQVKLMDNSKPINSEVTDKNLFVAVDSSLKKIEAIISS